MAMDLNLTETPTENPQLENGYTMIANETMDALAKIRIPGQARQVLDLILRKTYGWHKTKDAISLSQFVLGTGLSKVTVCKCLNKLLLMVIITKKGNAMSLFTQKGNDIIPTYGFQKKFRLWKPLPKKVTLPKKVIDVTQKGNRKTLTPIKTKETITKENIYIPVFDFWNLQKIIRHKKLDAKTKTAILSAIKNYSEKEITEAIKNYSEVITSDKYFFDHKWTLLDFLNRGLRKFVNDADPLHNFLTNGKEGIKNDEFEPRKIDYSGVRGRG